MANGSEQLNWRMGVGTPDRFGEKEQSVETMIARRFRFFTNLVQKAGPYLLLELLLPGGTLFALLLFAYQRKQALPAVLIGVIERAQSAIVDVGLHDIASAWRGRHRERDGLEALAMSPM